MMLKLSAKLDAFWIRKRKQDDVSIRWSWLWTIIFGPFYFLKHENYYHAATCFFAMFLTITLTEMVHLNNWSSNLISIILVAYYCFIGIYSLFSGTIISRISHGSIK